METMTGSERIKLTGDRLLDRLKDLLREGNARRIVIRHGEQTIAEFPLTVGVVGAALAPVLAAIGVLVALFADCSIEIERVVPTDSSTAPTKASADDEALER